MIGHSTESATAALAGAIHEGTLVILGPDDVTLAIEDFVLVIPVLVFLFLFFVFGYDEPELIFGLKLIGIIVPVDEIFLSVASHCLCSVSCA
jgi:hypothetical protein